MSSYKYGWLLIETIQMIILVCSWLRRVGNASQGVSIFFMIYFFILHFWLYIIFCAVEKINSFVTSPWPHVRNVLQERRVMKMFWPIVKSNTSHNFTSQVCIISFVSLNEEENEKGRDQTWYLSKNLHNPRFWDQNFTQKVHISRQCQIYDESA